MQFYLAEHLSCFCVALVAGLIVLVNDGALTVFVAGGWMMTVGAACTVTGWSRHGREGYH